MSKKYKTVKNKGKPGNEELESQMKKDQTPTNPPHLSEKNISEYFPSNIHNEKTDNNNHN